MWSPGKSNCGDGMGDVALVWHLEWIAVVHRKEVEKCGLVKLCFQKLGGLSGRMLTNWRDRVDIVHLWR